MGGSPAPLPEFLRFRAYVVYFIRHNVNDMHSILQVFMQFYANLRTFGVFLHDAPGLLRAGSAEILELTELCPEVSA